MGIGSKDPAPLFLLIYNNSSIEEPKAIINDLAECNIELKQGLIILRCEKIESLVEIILRFIEAGVSPFTPSTWICGPSRELGLIAFVKPSPCPDINIRNIVIGCRRLTLCTKTYTVLEDSRRLLIKRRRRCFIASIELAKDISLQQVVYNFFINEELAGEIFILSPLVVPWFPRGRGVWVNGCLK